MSNPLKIVNISNPNRHQAGKELLDAATSQGFLFIEGHGYSQTEIDELFKLAKQCFAMPSHEKAKLKLTGKEENVGYSDFHSEVLDERKISGKQMDSENQKQELKGDPKEAFNFGKLNFTTGMPAQKLPELVFGNGDYSVDVGGGKSTENLRVLRKNIKKLYEVSQQVLELLAIGLQIVDVLGKDSSPYENVSDRLPSKDNLGNQSYLDGSQWFRYRSRPEKKSGSALRFLRYPPLSAMSPAEEVRAGAHTDYGAITLLFQLEGQQGLEIHSPVSNQWEKVPFVKGGAGEIKCENSDEAKKEKDVEGPPIVVNIGDQLSYWSAGLLKLTMHRVKFDRLTTQNGEISDEKQVGNGSTGQGQDRYSIVFFAHPEEETLLEPIPSAIVEEHAKSQHANITTTNSKPITAKEHLDQRLARAYGWE